MGLRYYRYTKYCEKVSIVFTVSEEDILQYYQDYEFFNKEECLADFCRIYEAVEVSEQLSLLGEVT